MSELANLCTQACIQLALFVVAESKGSGQETTVMAGFERLNEVEAGWNEGAELNRRQVREERPHRCACRRVGGASTTGRRKKGVTRLGNLAGQGGMAIKISSGCSK
jgi:hypothetical protein